MLTRLAVVIWWSGFVSGALGLCCVMAGIFALAFLDKGFDFFQDALGSALSFAVVAVAALSVTYVLAGTFLRPPILKNS